MRGGGSVVLGVAGLTVAARIVGFARSVVFSKTVGDTCLGDAYNAANSLPNVLFEIVAGGVLAGTVVPVVARHLAAERRDAAAQTASALIGWTVLVLTLPAVVAFVGAQAYADAFAKPGCPGGAATIAALLVVFVPQVWLYGLAVVSAGILQAHHRFLAAALAPLLSSLVVAGSYLLFAGLGSRRLAVLGWGTTAGVLVLALTTLVPLFRLPGRWRPTLRFAPGDRGVLGRIALAGLIGLVLQQVSVLAINHAAQSQVPGEGALTRFTWANAIYLLPYAVLAAPLLQFAFPRLAAAAEQGDDAVRRVLQTVAPAVVVAACLGAALLVGCAVPVARVFVLGPGSGDTTALARPIAAFAPAVVGFALLGLASRTLLAAHRARAGGAATAVAWAAVIVSVLIAGQTVPRLALSVSVGMLLGAVVGWALVQRTFTLPMGPVVGRPLAAGLLAAVVAGAAAWWPATQLGDVGVVAASAGAVAVAAGQTLLFVGVLRVVTPALLHQLWAMRSTSAIEIAS